SESLYGDTVIKPARANAEYVPPFGKGALYIRPILSGIGMTLSPAASDTTLFAVTVLPVGLRYKGTAMMKIKVEDRYQRAAAKGTGWVKAAGNYAPCFLPTDEAKHEGFSDLLFLDQTGRYVEEVGTANFGMIKNGVLYVADSPSILKGITRDSIMRLAREQLGMEVIFAPLELDRVLGLGAFEKDGPADEVFAMGTAAVISPISHMSWQGRTWHFGDNPGPWSQKLYDALDGVQTGRYPDPYGWVTVLD
ncbi:MAG: aminotransferase class IV, partial [Rectinema sp.]|nr:aminotransferase class IV [Rectinema sp.]